MFPNVTGCPVARIGPVVVIPAVAVNNPVTSVVPETVMFELTILEVRIDPVVIDPEFDNDPEL
jgi:hypothetical protein